MFLTHCASVEKTGRYEQTGRIPDLIGEPTLDMWKWNGVLGYNRYAEYWNADGHDGFDAVIVASEKLLFLPCTICYGISILGILPGVIAGDWIQKHNLADTLYTFWAFPFYGLYAGTYYLNVGLLMVYDTIFHDIPVIVVGRPVHTLLAKTGAYSASKPVETHAERRDRKQRRENEKALKDIEENRSTFRTR
jgi:hypothetical protein